jgi:hypothetical protein
MGFYRDPPFWQLSWTFTRLWDKNFSEWRSQPATYTIAADISTAYGFFVTGFESQEVLIPSSSAMNGLSLGIGNSFLKHQM